MQILIDATATACPMQEVYPSATVVEPQRHGSVNRHVAATRRLAFATYRPIGIGSQVP
jgi:hypothetical protein